jgi:hypothetical protein
LSYIELSTNIGGGNNLSAEPPGTPSYWSWQEIYRLLKLMLKDYFSYVKRIYC